MAVSGVWLGHDALMASAARTEALRKSSRFGRWASVGCTFFSISSIESCATALDRSLQIRGTTPAGSPLPPLFPVLRDELGVSWVALGVISSVFYAVSGLAQPIAGFFVDRVGARRVLLSGMVLFGAAIASAGLAPTYAALLPIAALAGKAEIQVGREI